MSTTTEPDLPRTSPYGPETAPSAVAADEPTTARMVGFVGLFALVLGAVAVVTTQALGPRIISAGVGYLLAAVGLTFMLYHAIRDGDTEVRRLYGGFAVLALVLGLAAALIPGPVFTSAPEGGKAVGYNLLPWGVGAGLIGLIFLVPYGRHETDPTFRAGAEYLLLGVGGLLLVGSLVAGIANPDTLAGPGVALALLGLGFICGFLGLVDSSEGLGYAVASALGAVGAAVVVYAVARAAVPVLLYDGPGVLRRPNGTLDPWRVAGRVIAVLFFLGLLASAVWCRMPTWVRGTLGAIGVGGAVVLVVASVKANTVTTLPAPFLVPGGVLLIGLGTLFAAIALGVCSDNQLVTLTRRELAAYFLSPIGYLVLGGMAAAQWWGYREFVAWLSSRGTTPEPIVQTYFVALLPVFAIVLEVPALTMRLLSEEKRTGSLEVLLTAPVNETPVVLSKFLGTWIFFMLSWVPAGLYLVALRAEGGVPFDYRPLLSFYAALAAQGVTFIALGLLFSSLTRDQIVAAVLMFVAMLFFVACFLVRESPAGYGLGSTVQAALGRISFLHVWLESLSGQLPVRDVLLFLSGGVFCLFVTVKVLEARKWS